MTEEKEEEKYPILFIVCSLFLLVVSFVIFSPSRIEMRMQKIFDKSVSVDGWAKICHNGVPNNSGVSIPLYDTPCVTFPYKGHHFSIENDEGSTTPLSLYFFNDELSLKIYHGKVVNKGPWTDDMNDMLSAWLDSLMARKKAAQENKIAPFVAAYKK